MSTITGEQEAELLIAALAEAGYPDPGIYFGRCRCHYPDDLCLTDSVRLPPEAMAIPEAVRWRAHLITATAAERAVRCWPCWSTRGRTRDCGHDWRAEDHPPL